MKEPAFDVPSDFTLLKGDASSRRYYRGRGYILVKYPPDAGESFDNFLFWAKRYQEIGIRVPDILNKDRDRMEMQLEDWGDINGVSWFQQLETREEKIRFVDSVYRLIPLARSLEQESTGKSIDVGRELDFFLQHTESTIFRDRDISWLTSLCAEIVRVLRDRDWKLAHRDFHFRNILVQNGEICIIDFQDTRHAPEFYDNVSLLFDNYLDLTEIASDVEPNLDSSEMRWVALQRNLKALGTFAWFGYKQGKNWFRESVPLGMRHVESHLHTLGLNAETGLWRKLIESAQL